MIQATNLDTVFMINASINLVCTLMYVLAGYMPVGGAWMLILSRCLLGFGSVQTAKLQYLGCAVSKPKVTFSHFVTSAIIAYGFAFGVFLAFFVSLVATSRGWNQNTAPGWFTAALWLMYMGMHKLIFVEPDVNAGIVDPESQIRLQKEMRPPRHREPIGGLSACFVAIFAIAVVQGSFEVLTIEVSQDLWQWNVMESSLFLGAVMLIVALTTLLSQGLEKRVGEGLIFFIGMVGATTLLPFYYIPVSVRFERRMGSDLGMLVYLLVSIVTLSLLNLGRTIAFTLTTELPSPHWRGHFLSTASQAFTMGRGVGPILAGVAASKVRTVTCLTIIAFMATVYLAFAWLTGRLDAKEHELGPARADLAEDEDPETWVSAMDSWFGWVTKQSRSAQSSSAPPQTRPSANLKDPDATHPPTLALGSRNHQPVSVVGKPVSWAPNAPAVLGQPCGQGDASGERHTNQGAVDADPGRVEM